MNRESFENYLLNGNVTERYLNLPKEELRLAFGEDFFKTVEFGNQNNNSHQYELFEHILRTVDEINSTTLSSEDLLKLKLAAFFHDIGKPSVAKLNEKTGQTQYFDHANKSAQMAIPILFSLGYTQEEIDELVFLIKNHDAFIQLDTVNNITKENVGKVLDKMTNSKDGYNATISDIRKLLVLCRADISAQADVIVKGGVTVDTKTDRLDRLNLIEETLPESICLSQNKCLEKLYKDLETIKNGPKKIIKNGEVKNQKQIDNWLAQSDEEKRLKAEAILKEIANVQTEIDRLLEKNNGHSIAEVQNVISGLMPGDPTQVVEEIVEANSTRTDLKI